MEEFVFILAQLLVIGIGAVGVGARAVTTTLVGPVHTGIAAVKGKEGYGIELDGIGIRAVISTVVGPVHTGVAAGLLEVMEVMDGLGGLSCVLSCCVLRAWL